MHYYLAIDFRNATDDVRAECLRYAGLKECQHVVNGIGYYRCPKGLLFKPWSTSNIARMATFGVKASTVRY